MSKMTAPNIDELLKEVQSLLNAKCKRRKFRLEIPPQGYTIEDDWITIVVAPGQAVIRAYEYMEILSEVEKELRAHGHEHVLLVPAMAG